jgi:Tfp pilus assembly protein PilX
MKSDNLKMKYYQSKHNQQGAVLLISLMILLILTLIGLSSLNGSLLEEKMAANAQTSTTIFQAAESKIHATHLGYENSQTQDLAVIRAQNNADPVPNSNYDTGGNTKLEYKREMPPPPNYSADLFTAHGIEIVGTASKNGIEESNTQGYNVFPFPARNI